MPSTRKEGGKARNGGGSRADLTSGGKDGLMDDPPRLRVVGGRADAEDEPPLHPEVAEFVRWFTSWWLTRGLELVTHEEADQQRAA